jgi:hypothetical protein
MKTNIERQSSMVNDRNNADMSITKNNPNDLFALTTYGGLGIGAGLNMNLGMGHAKNSLL